jgi:dienelactone hydrolase
MVFNHGSEDLPGWKPDQARFYTAHGYAVFVPHRRGQGRSADAGVYIDRVFETHDGNAIVDALVQQNDDVLAGIAYFASLPYIDKKRIAVAGCSLGGIESLFAAERATGIVAAVDFAGASMTWARYPELQERMKVAARNARVPVFFIQAENDFNTAPSLILSEEARKAGRNARVHIWPANGTTPMDGHHFCAAGDAPAWGDEVLAFLDSAMPPG